MGLLKTLSGADPLVRAGPPGPALWRSITFPAGRRGRRLRTRGSAPLGVFNGVGAPLVVSMKSYQVAIAAWSLSGSQL